MSSFVPGANDVAISQNMRWAGKDSESGWTISVGDMAGLEACVRDLAKCPEKVRQAGCRARQIFDSRYSKARPLPSGMKCFVKPLVKWGSVLLQSLK
ncbi:MAG: hypothetical protein OJF51_005112 [Nitrospira sp.]|jgi:hypothetical protein|nr:MAG: hypothetical protein OJF51_005112 [Nitrospira sp.]